MVNFDRVSYVCVEIDTFSLSLSLPLQGRADLFISSRREFRMRNSHTTAELRRAGFSFLSLSLARRSFHGEVLPEPFYWRIHYLHRTRTLSREPRLRITLVPPVTAASEE